EIPLYNYDLEVNAGIPASVAALKDRIAAARGLLLSTPEYNNSIPGVLKNTIDWLSRPPSDSQRVFGGRLIAIMGASPGNYGTVQSQTAWLPILRTLRMPAWVGGRLALAHAGAVFDEAGVLKDDKVRAQLRDFVQGFVQFVAASRSPKSPSSASIVESAASGAVSARRVRGPSRQAMKPWSCAIASSCALRPPSGPISRLKATIARGPDSAWAALARVCAPAGASSSRAPAPGAVGPRVSAQARSKVTGGLSSGMRLRPHCSQALIATACQCCWRRCAPASSRRTMLCSLI